MRGWRGWACATCRPSVAAAMLSCYGQGEPRDVLRVEPAHDRCAALDKRDRERRTCWRGNPLLAASQLTRHHRSDHDEV